MKTGSVLLVAALMTLASPLFADAGQTESRPAPDIQNRVDDMDAKRKADLEKRVSERWAAMIDKDFAGAYTYFSPAYRKIFPLESYLRETGPNVDWISAKVLEISIKGNSAQVKVHLDYRLNLPPEAGLDDMGIVSENLDETWLWKDGNWWFVHQKNGLSA